MQGGCRDRSCGDRDGLRSVTAVIWSPTARSRRRHPQRDIDRILALTSSRGIAVTRVFETHIHNDYISGGLALARETGAAYHVNGADEVACAGRDRRRRRDRVGNSFRVRVSPPPAIRSPTFPTRLRTPPPARWSAVFTGGSLLHGSTGRPGPARRRHAPGLAAAQHASARRLAAMLPGPGRGLSHPRVRQLLRGRSLPRVGRDRPSPRSSGQPGARPWTRTPTSLACWRAWKISGVLRPDGPANTAGPEAPDLMPCRRAPGTRSGGGSPQANGSSTCATAGRSRPGTCPDR